MTNDIVSQIILPLSLFIIMLGMGLSLTLKDFTGVAAYPRAAMIGITGQMLVLPVVGFGLAAWLMPTPSLAIGLVLLAACPGGTTSNLLTYLARGDLALSISLTAMSSLLAIFTIPLITGLAFHVFADQQQTVAAPVGNMMAALFAMTLLPVIIGMFLRSRSLRLAKWLEPKINLFGAVFFVLLVVFIVAQQGSALLPELASGGLAILLLNLTMMGLGLGAALAFGLNARQATSITLETGIQNSTLAILVATTFLHDSQLAIPAALYSLIMYLSAGIVIGFRYRQHAASGVSVEAAR